MQVLNFGLRAEADAEEARSVLSPFFLVQFVVYHFQNLYYFILFVVSSHFLMLIYCIDVFYLF